MDQENYQVLYSELPNLQRGQALSLKEILRYLKNRNYETLVDEKTFRIYRRNKSLKLKLIKKELFKYENIIL